MENIASVDRVRQSARNWVSGSATLGLIACAFGGLQAGWIGIGLGLALSWTATLLGLAAFYCLEHRPALAAAEEAEPAEWPVQSSDVV
jgi:hypothetical protein